MAQYTEDFITRLHMVWGAGFLSPGGPEEVREIVRGLDLAGERVLDIGCGTGGPSVTLAKMGAHVTGIDVEPHLLDHAGRIGQAAGLADRLVWRCVAPGPLDFPDGAFDVVFSKDALIHVPDKPALYREVLRALRPGGVFAASDWLAGANAANDPAYLRWLAISNLDFVMATAAETETAMHAAGFAEVASRDRNAWYAPMATAEVDRIEGPLWQELVAAVGEETMTAWSRVRRALADATQSGGLRPTHLRGIRPA